jgi:uncharacterized flavoprotein (TIGR03862 family)
MANSVAIIGAGPAGLMAAERLSALGWRVDVYDQMPSVGRKFLLAGRGGLNLTHSEPFENFVTRYAAAADWARPMLEAFPPDALMAWARRLGQEVFVGSSGRVFPVAMKASPLLRAWLARLAQQGVVFHLRHAWRGWTEDGALAFQAPEGPLMVGARATLLALGGGSWPKLGSDGSWTQVLERRGVAVAPLRASNCGVTIPWSQHFSGKFAGHPLSNISLMVNDRTARGEAMISSYGLEGGAVYQLSAPLRDAIDAGGARVAVDLRPDLSAETLIARLTVPRGRDSFSNFLRKRLNLSPAAIGLMREAYPDLKDAAPPRIATAVKSVSLPVTGHQTLERAISSVGGVSPNALTPLLMFKALPGVFAAGEMIDWDAPTGGYLLQLCFATAVRAAEGILSSSRAI